VGDFWGRDGGKQDQVTTLQVDKPEEIDFSHAARWLDD
jgi:hypothetical protein